MISSCMSIDMSEEKNKGNILNVLDSGELQV